MSEFLPFIIICVVIILMVFAIRKKTIAKKYEGYDINPRPIHLKEDEGAPLRLYVIIMIGITVVAFLLRIFILK